MSKKDKIRSIQILIRQFYPILPLIFSLTLDEICEQTKNAMEMFQTWKSSYFEVREKIENTKGQRWEFDRRRLFGESDYFARVLGDLNYAAKVNINT